MYAFIIDFLLPSCRAQEEVSSLKRKLEKYKTREWAASGDEVLLEEIKTYKVKGLARATSSFFCVSHNAYISTVFSNSQCPTF